MCGMSIASVKQPLMNGVTAVHYISCTAIEPRHGREGTARHGHVPKVGLLRRECHANFNKLDITCNEMCYRGLEIELLKRSLTDTCTQTLGFGPFGRR
jgi:hypothetical protein